MSPIQPAMLSTTFAAIIALIVCVGVLSAWAIDKWQGKT
jgi:hypothetical protein